MTDERRDAPTEPVGTPAHEPGEQAEPDPTPVATASADPNGGPTRGTAEAAEANPLAGIPPEPPPDAPPDVVASVAAEPSPFASISLSARQLVAGTFDLMAKAQRELRLTSFYLGFIALVTFGPLAALIWAFVVRFDLVNFDAAGLQAIGEQAEGAAIWLLLASVVALAGFLALAIESQATTIAVLGARLQGRPLSVSGAVRIARHRFWRLFGAAILVGIVTRIAQTVVGLTVGPVIADQPDLALIVELAVTILVQTPFIYATAGIVLGEVGVIEALRRSTRLFRAKPALALTVALFGVATQFILIFGVFLGLDLVVRVAQPFGLGEGGVAIFLGTVLSAVLSFAFGTLIFTAAALASAPQVIAFVGLTHYAGGLEGGRVERTPRGVWDPFVSGGMAVAIVLGLISLFMGIVEIGS